MIEKLVCGDGGRCSQVSCKDVDCAVTHQLKALDVVVFACPHSAAVSVTLTHCLDHLW